MTKSTMDTDEAPRLVGYARVSTADQSVQMQIDALVKAGVAEEHVYSESASGSKKDRPQLARALRSMRPGDTLIVWKLDRIARSMTHLLELLQGLEADGKKFRSLTEGIETQTPSGRLIMHMLAALAEFERDLIRERSRAGVKAAQARGVKFGAEEKVSDAQVLEAWKRVHEGGETRKDVAKSLKITTMTLSRRFKKLEAERAARSKKRAAKKTASKKKKKPVTRRRRAT